MPKIMKKVIITLLILSLAVASFGSSTRNETLYYAAPHFPPWDINPDENESSGINADVIRSIAEELKLTFQPIKCPWRRCLSLLEEGKIDMAGTVGKKPERELFLYFIEPTYAKIPDQVFYLSINSKVEIKKYQDLYRFNRIGIERGAKVSPIFDEDTTLMKDEITKLDQLFKMLDQGRLDVVAGNEMVMDHIIKRLGMHGKFQKAHFRFKSVGGEYMVISKKSPHAKRLDEISQVIHNLKKSGKIQELIEHYTND